MCIRDRSFQESQIFRIDHYLGKETVQNILAFRFANPMFEPIWNRRYVDYLTITVAEEVGVGHRGKYYEQAGELRDMVQNHLMQLLCLVAMEAPVSFSAHGNLCRAATVRGQLALAGCAFLLARGQTHAATTDRDCHLLSPRSASLV